MVGGRSEEITLKARKIIMANLRSAGSEANMQLFTLIGKVPPYYAGFDEPILGDALEDERVNGLLNNLDKRLLRDYLNLLIACSGEYDFDLIKRRNSGFAKDDFSQLQTGYENLINYNNNNDF